MGTSRGLTAVLIATFLALGACGGGSTDGAAPASGPDDTGTPAATGGSSAPGDTSAVDGSDSTSPATVPLTVVDTGATDPSDGSTTGSTTTGSTDTTDTTVPGASTTTAVAPAAPALAPAKPGDKGDGVAALQTRLDELGFSTGAADGSYGRRTTDAVRGFQLVAGLPTTGEADGATLTALAVYQPTGTILRAGDEGPAVAALQQRLSDGPFDPGPIDGKYGPATVEAVWALSKLTGVPVDSDWGPVDDKALELLAAGTVGQPQVSHDRRWVEVDLSTQLMSIYDPGAATPVLVSHISSGSGQAWSNEEHSGSSITPKGSFAIYKRISGWRESSLDIGRLYNPLYFTGGIAFHGALSVPLYPASHGCIRVPMHIAEYLPGELPDGTPVDVVA